LKSDPDVFADALVPAQCRWRPADVGFPNHHLVIRRFAAHKWFNLAALRGRADAIQMRREVAELMSSDEIAVAQRDARYRMMAH
jgi:hypothetical protein